MLDHCVCDSHLRRVPNSLNPTARAMSRHPTRARSRTGIHNNDTVSNREHYPLCAFYSMMSRSRRYTQCFVPPSNPARDSPSWKRKSCCLVEDCRRAFSPCRRRLPADPRYPPGHPVELSGSLCWEQSLHQHHCKWGAETFSFMEKRVPGLSGGDCQITGGHRRAPPVTINSPLRFRTLPPFLFFPQSQPSTKVASSVSDILFLLIRHPPLRSNPNHTRIHLPAHTGIPAFW